MYGGGEKGGEGMSEPRSVKTVEELEAAIGGDMYSVCSGEPRGRQIAVVVPYGSNRGIRLFLRGLRQFIWAAWRELS